MQITTNNGDLIITFGVSPGGAFSRTTKTKNGILIETTRDTLKMVKLLVGRSETWTELSILTADAWWKWKCKDKGYIRGQFNEELYRKIRVERIRRGIK